MSSINLKKTAWTFQVWFKAALMQGKTTRTWWAFGGERDNSRQKSRFRERKVARKPGMLPQTNLLKCIRSSWQFPFNFILLNSIQFYWLYQAWSWSYACTMMHCAAALDLLKASDKVMSSSSSSPTSIKGVKAYLKGVEKKMLVQNLIFPCCN